MARLVVALGGNALLRRGESPSTAAQREHVRRAAGVIGELVEAGNTVVVTHGNGPQVGLLAAQSVERGGTGDPLDVLGAESQGMIGYLLELALRNRLPASEVATLLSQVVVDGSDAAFAHPSKPIGPWLTPEEAIRLAAAHGWTLVAGPDGQRRVVPSPEPLEVLEIGPLRRLVDAATVVISAGGGGVPVVRQADGTLRGVEGVVDKDLTAALLAEQIGADWLLMLTDVAGVCERWGDPSARRFRFAPPEALRAYAFAPGSMGPKVEAACRFVERTGAVAAIGAVEDAARILSGEAGTVVRGGARVGWW